MWIQKKYLKLNFFHWLKKHTDWYSTDVVLHVFLYKFVISAATITMCQCVLVTQLHQQCWLWRLSLSITVFIFKGSSLAFTSPQLDEGSFRLLEMLNVMFCLNHTRQFVIINIRKIKCSFQYGSALVSWGKEERRGKDSVRKGANEIDAAG